MLIASIKLISRGLVVIKKLAKVKNAKLYIDRNVLSFKIDVDFEEGLSMMVGGITLDRYNGDADIRVGTAYGCEIIRRMLIEFNVNDFSEMKGLLIYVIGEGEGLSFTQRGVQSLRVNNPNSEPVIFDEVFKFCEDLGI